MSGISRSGDLTTILFSKITDFHPYENPSDKKGDAWIFYENKIINVEIKKDTLNQVRPYKYNVLVGHDTKSQKWYVIPPDDIIDMVKNKRGQHTTDPVECVGLGKILSKKYEKYFVSDVSSLKDKIIKAFIKSEQNIAYKNYANKKKNEYEDKPRIITEEISQLRKNINE